MKILRLGKIFRKKTNIECVDCKTLVEVTADDLEFVSDQRDGNFYWFTCPVCSKRRAIAEALVK